MILITKKCPLWPYLALYMQFLWHALFTKATPTNYTICYNLNCHINERETPKTCLTNHKGSISHHIMPLVINSLGGGHIHTHTQAYSHCGQKQLQETSHAPAEGWRMPGLTSWCISLSKNQALVSVITLYYKNTTGILVQWKLIA